MKRTSGLLLFVTSLSVISGYLMSKASLVGKAGMSLFYKEYNFLKTWWKGGLLIFGLLLLLYILLQLIIKKLPPEKARIVLISSCIVAVIGLYFTYNDFRHTLSHRLLGERFHLGVYLFWLGWIVISMFHIFNAQIRSPKESRSVANEF